MGTPTDVYVDPSIAGNSGSGTVGDPYGDLQYALDTVTRDSTNGDQFNVKAGTDELIAASLDLTSYGSPASSAPLLFRGYTTSKGDGGLGGIDMQGNNNTILDSSHTHWTDMHLHGTGSAAVVTVALSGSVQQCEIDNGTGIGIRLRSGECLAMNNYVHNIGGVGIALDNSGCRAMYNYLKNGTNDFTTAIDCGQSYTFAIGNIISLDGTSDGIDLGNHGVTVIGNQILHTGSGDAIFRSLTRRGHTVLNNLIEIATGTGIDFGSGGDSVFSHGHNAVYASGAGTEYSTGSADIAHDIGDNETLSATPFEKTGSEPTDFTAADFWSDLGAYFAPANTGKVRAA